MTKLLEHAFEKAKTLPADRQDEIGEMLLELVEQDNSGLQLSQAQEAEVRRRLALPQSLVTSDEMEAFFRKLTG